MLINELGVADPSDVVVLDARGVAGGATGRNGGHLWPNPASDFEAATVAELLAFIEREAVDCDLTRGGAAAFERSKPETGVEYHDAPDDPEAVGAEEEWGEVVQWDETACGTRVQTDAFVGAAHYEKAWQFFPAKVAAALLRKSRATLCTPVRVLAIEDAAADDPWQRIRWASGQDGEPSTSTGVLRARRVVVATNGWAAELVPELKGHLYATRNSVIMTAPLPSTEQWGIGAWSVDSDIGARELYAIRRPDGRVCLGGARALEPGAAVGNSDDSSSSELVGAYLRDFLPRTFPALRGADGSVPIEAEWSGVLGFTTDGKPVVGPLPGRPELIVAAGFCGHGMPQCFGVGKGVAQMLDGSPERMGELHPFLRDECNVGRFGVGTGPSAST